MNKIAAEKLTEARIKKGWTQSKAADLLGKGLGQTYSLRQYQKLEDGNFPKFKTEVSKELDRIFNTNLHELIYEHGTAVPGHGIGGPEPADGKYVQLMEKVISGLERDKEWLQGVIDTNLVALLGQTGAALSYQKAWVEYVADRDSVGDVRKRKEIRARLDKLIGANTGTGAKTGMHTADGNSSKD